MMMLSFACAAPAMAGYIEQELFPGPDVNSDEELEEYVKTLQLPPGIEARIWGDWSHIFKGRMNLLLKNSISGHNAEDCKRGDHT